jgi:hypothetical protein
MNLFFKISVLFSIIFIPLMFTACNGDDSDSCDGYLSVQGQLCEQNVNVESQECCGYLNYKPDRKDVSIEGLDVNGRELVIEMVVESLSQNTVNRVIDIQEESLDFEVRGDYVINGCDPSYFGTPISGYDAVEGTVIIEFYDDSQIVGSFDVVLPNGEAVSGSFDAILDERS